MISSSATFYFNDPRLRLTVAGRMLVRIIFSVSYAVVCTFAVLFFFISDFPLGVASAIFCLLFVCDIFIHRRASDFPLHRLPTSGSVNLSGYVSPEAAGILERSLDRSRLHRLPLPFCILFELLKTQSIVRVFERLDVAPSEFILKLGELAQREGSAAVAVSTPDLTSFFNTLVLAALPSALSLREGSIEVTDLLCGLAAIDAECTGRLFTLFSLQAEDVRKACAFGAALSSFSPRSGFVATLFGASHTSHRVVNRSWTSRATPTLDRFARDLTDAARSAGLGSVLVGHEVEYRRFVEVLSRPDRPNVLLVGDEGSGKQAMVAHLAADVVRDHVPSSLFDKRVVELDIALLVSGAQADELSARVTALATEIIESGNIIVFIPDFHNLTKSTEAAFLSAADALLPIVKNSAFPVVGATYPIEFKKYLESRSDITGLFEVIHISEISPAEAEELVSIHAAIFERQTGIPVSFAAIKLAVALAKKYFHDRLLPASALDIISQAFSHAASTRAASVDVSIVTAVAQERTSVPVQTSSSAAEADKLLHLEDTIHERFIDQDEAVHAIADALREYRSGLARPGGPIASFLFVGPTGVGKTELAKVITQLQFGPQDQFLVRFDMSEYKELTSISRLIGNATGVSGALTEAVRQKPYSVVLFDEFEKAHPEILDLLLPVLDEAKLTDGLGRTIDFANTIIIATSNAHSDIINRALVAGERMESIGEFLKNKLSEVFRVELLNRFSRIVVFHDLALADIKRIARLQLNDLSVIAAGQGIEIVFDDLAVDAVARLGYEPALGVRPMRRLIDDRLRSLLAQKILSGSIGRGGRLRVTFANGQFDFVSS